MVNKNLGDTNSVVKKSNRFIIETFLLKLMEEDQEVMKDDGNG